MATILQQLEALCRENKTLSKIADVLIFWFTQLVTSGTTENNSFTQEIIWSGGGANPIGGGGFRPVKLVDSMYQSRSNGSGIIQRHSGSSLVDENTITIHGSPYFRGYEPPGKTVLAIRFGSRWMAIGSGRTRGKGILGTTLNSGSSVTMTLSGSHNVSVYAYLGGIASGKKIIYNWDEAAQRFYADAGEC